MPAPLSTEETCRTLYAPDAPSAAAIRDALAAAGYAAEFRPEGAGFVVAFLVVGVAKSTVSYPRKDAIQSNGGAPIWPAN